MGYANTQKTDFSRYDCGTQALAYLLEQAGKRGMADTLRAVEPLSEKGFTVSDLLRMAEPLKLSANILNLQDLHDIKLPAILHFQGNTGHFAVLTEAGDDFYTILEPKTGGIRQLSKEDLLKSSSGVVLFQDSGDVGTFMISCVTHVKKKGTSIKI
jgi:ATP-binding cassette subfamily B protein RaxB